MISRAFVFAAAFLAAASFVSAQTTAPATQPASTTVETVVFLRHGEKPAAGLGQLTPQGLNRALALATVLPKKFGKPDFIFAPDPAALVYDYGSEFSYIRPLATIEPLAIRLQMPVQTPFGYKDIDKLDAELAKPKYARATIFVAWEHGYAAIGAADLLKIFGNNSDVPKWPGRDYDSLYIIKITRAPGARPIATFIHDHEGLNGQSTQMPAPAPK